VSSGGAAVLIVALPVIAGCTLFLWLGGCFSLTLPAAAIEGTGGFAALRRSWQLSKGSRARVIVTWAMVFIFSLLMYYGLLMAIRPIFIHLCREYPLWAFSQQLDVSVTYLLRALISILAGPIYPISLTLFYYDQRIRMEGFDIERMMDAAGLIAPLPPPAGDSPIASNQEEGRL